MPDAAANVAGVYATLRDDVDNGTFDAASFEHALRLTQLVSDLEASSREGIRIKAGVWPDR